MIDTIVFDIGNVLVDWHWRKSFAEKFGEALVEPIADATVRSPEWYELDRGVLGEDEVVALLTKNAPEYAAQIEWVVRESHQLVTTYPYAADWLHSLQAAGYKTYLLSNFSAFGYERAKPGFTFLPYTDGALISYEVKLVKPDPAIYAALCERFSITPENAVFLDDRPENTEAARAFGMHAVTVESKAQADSALHALGVQY